MRILYFSRDYTPHDHRFLSALAGTEHEVYYLRLERRGSAQEDRMLPEGVRWVPWAGGQRPFRWRHLPRLLTSLRKVLREVRPDVVHAGPLPTVGFLAALSGFHPLVAMSWGSDLLLEAESNPADRRRTAFTLRRTDVFVGDCQAVADKAAGYGFPGERMVTFPWGVDLAHFSPEGGWELRERYGWADAFVVLHLRSWEAVYGVDVFAEGFARAARQRPELRLLMLGNGSLAAEVRKRLLPAGLERIHFGGQVTFDRLPDFYRAADLYVSASHSDGSSVSLMEALACGVPALVSDIPGNREWVREGEQGWLFPDGDAQALAEGILRAVEKREALGRMGERARALAETRADWSKNFEKLLAAYKMALNVRR